MKERPILFSGEMVRAILDGRKTQTRRKMKPRPPSGVPSVVHCEPLNADFNRFAFWIPEDDSPVFLSKPIPGARHFKMCSGLTGNVKLAGKKTCHWKCPYGVPGDRLWVKETWLRGDLGSVFYREDFVSGIYQGHSPNFTNWKSSIHMPRSAARITLEITNIRVERLHAIGEDDAKAEGVQWDGDYFLGGVHEVKGTQKCWATARDAFKAIWQSINRPGSWEKNPWVWVVEFKRIA